MSRTVYLDAENLETPSFGHSCSIYTHPIERLHMLGLSWQCQSTGKLLLLISKAMYACWQHIKCILALTSQVSIECLHHNRNAGKATLRVSLAWHLRLCISVVWLSLISISCFVSLICCLVCGASSAETAVMPPVPSALLRLMQQLEEVDHCKK